MKNFNTNTDNNNEWITPLYITKSLGTFDLDPCQPKEPPWIHAKRGFSVNGLEENWSPYKRIWLNPPYGRETFNWLRKLSVHGNGIALIFARTETVGFHTEVWEKADAIFFFKGRIKFYKVDGTQANNANAPSCLIIYGKDNIPCVEHSGLKGKLLRVKA